jgi:AbrB family looped-hinge helix DNA binding protein
MATATVTSKGQVTIPITVRSALGLESGDRLEFVEVERGRFEIVAASSSIRSLKGKISKPKKPVSIEEMNRIVAGKGMSAK